MNMLTLSTKLNMTAEDTQRLLDVFTAEDDTLYKSLTDEQRATFNQHYDSIDQFVTIQQALARAAEYRNNPPAPVALAEARPARNRSKRATRMLDRAAAKGAK